MEQHYLTNEQIAAFASSRVRAERTPATIEKYLRSVRAFFLYLDGQPVTKDAVVAWKEHLQSVGGYSPSTVNASLAAINDLFTFLGWTDCRAHYLKVQRRLFRDAGQELGREDYERLITAVPSQDGSGLRWSWKQSAPPASESARCAISPWRRQRKAVPPSL